MRDAFAFPVLPEILDKDIARRILERTLGDHYNVMNFYFLITGSSQRLSHF